MDIKFTESSKDGTTCSGFYFRQPSKSVNEGSYSFTICDDAHYEIYYYGNENWEVITRAKPENTIHISDWNRIEIYARGDEFTFIINNSQVYTMTDDRLEKGELGIYIEVYEATITEIWFDNFGYQSR